MKTLRRTLTIAIALIIGIGNMAAYGQNEIGGGRKPDTNVVAGHKFVDLGLSVKWATCNIGAEEPSDFGHYFSWGETYPKPDYSRNNSIWYKKKAGDISADKSYDAARVHWGASWRLPTPVEIRELRDNCTWKWTTVNDVRGYLVTGPNGNSIFLPTGGGYSESNCRSVGEDGNYWCSSPVTNDNERAYVLIINAMEHDLSSVRRFFGNNIRPVTE